jgi:hypothetical protein
MILPTPITTNLLLSALAPSELALLVPHFRGTAFEAGQTIQEAEVPVEQVWFPLSGMITLGIVTFSGTIIETAVVGREGVVGALIGLGACKAFCRAVVVVRGRGVAISALRFQEIARGSEAVRNLILNYKELLLSQVQQTAAQCNAFAGSAIGSVVAADARSRSGQNSCADAGADRTVAWGQTTIGDGGGPGAGTEASHPIPPRQYRNP